MLLHNASSIMNVDSSSSSSSSSSLLVNDPAAPIIIQSQQEKRQQQEWHVHNHTSSSSIIHNAGSNASFTGSTTTPFSFSAVQSSIEISSSSSFVNFSSSTTFIVEGSPLKVPPNQPPSTTTTTTMMSSVSAAPKSLQLPAIRIPAFLSSFAQKTQQSSPSPLMMMQQQPVVQQQVVQKSAQTSSIQSIANADSLVNTPTASPTNGSIVINIPANNTQTTSTTTDGCLKRFRCCSMLEKQSITIDQGRLRYISGVKDEDRCGLFICTTDLTANVNSHTLAIIRDEHFQEGGEFTIPLPLVYRLGYAQDRSHLRRHQWCKDGKFSYVMKVATQNSTESDEPNFKSTLQRNSRYRMIYFNKETGYVTAWSDTFEANAHKKKAQTTTIVHQRGSTTTTTTIMDSIDMGPQKLIQKKQQRSLSQKY